MPTTTLSVRHQQRLPPCEEVDDSAFDDDTQSYFAHEPGLLHILSEHDYVRSLIRIPSERSACARPHPHPHLLSHASRVSVASPLQRPPPRRRPRSLMALSYAHDAHSAFTAPGSPPDLTNSKSSKSSSFHSSTLSDFMGTSDLTHFEDINLDEVASGPTTFPVPASPSNRVIFEASKPALSSRSLSHQPAGHHSVRDLTSTANRKYPSLKGQVQHAVQRQQGQQLSAPGKQYRRGFTSPSVPSLSTLSLAAPHRSSRSPSPSSAHTAPSAPRTLSRKSSRTSVLPSPGLPSSRRQSWQDTRRKTVKEREAECDDEDDELPEDAVVWNIPISPRPMQERSPISSTQNSPPQTSPNPSSLEAASAKTSPGPSPSRYRHEPPSPNVSARDYSPPTQLSRQHTHTWQDTYTALDADAKKLTEALEDFQTDFERKQEVQRQQPGLTRSASVSQPESKQKKPALPPVRKSDPLIDPFQPSIEKEKYLSRTRPSWLPPKDPKEEKKHLKEYQRMLARIEEAGKIICIITNTIFQKLICIERLEAQRAEEEALAREKATRIKAEYWSSLLLPNWATEMVNPELRAGHRKMWWNGVPPRLRGQVWQKAVGNDLEVTEATYTVALEKARSEVQMHGMKALDGRYERIVQSTYKVFPELKMFAPQNTSGDQEQPLHSDLVNICLAYATYRPDSSPSNTGIQHIAALLLLNLAAPQAFITLSNMLNRPLPLSFLIHDSNAMYAAYSTTMHALARKIPSLATRLESLRVEPREYLASMFDSLFCGRLGVEHAARIMDIYSIEGDKIPPRVAVAIMGILEGSCMEGDAAHVAQTLREKEITLDVDDFMHKVYEAGKSS